MSRKIQLFQTHDPHGMMIQIGEELDKAYDLKNREVRDLKTRVDQHLRTMSTLERRALLVASRRKKG